jgi:hypothetical protein
MSVSSTFVLFDILAPEKLLYSSWGQHYFQGVIVYLAVIYVLV